MKRFLFVLLMTIHTVSYSQIQKGSIQLGGTIGYSTSNLKDRPLNVTDYENKSLLVLPKVGYFISSTSALGLGLGYTDISVFIQTSSYSGNTLQIQRNKTSQKIYTINPYYRLHRSVSGSVAFFVEINGLYGFGKGRNIRDRESYTFYKIYERSSELPSMSSGSHDVMREKLTMWGAGISPGIVFFPSNKFGIDLSIGLLEYTKSSNNISQTSSELSLLSNLSNILVGGRFYISR